MTTLAEKINAGHFLVCSELSPPQDCDGAAFREKARALAGLVDAVNVTDNATAVVRMSSIASAKILLEEGLEPIMQMTCRDRNRLAIQSDLLGAAALGIRNLLCLTGDHQSVGDQPEARGVFDLDSIQLIGAAARMNSGFLLSGRAMRVPPDFLIGAAANPFAEPFAMRLIRLEKKIDAGARFIQTQPVFDHELFGRWMDAVVRRGLDRTAAIIAGVMPVRSARSLLWMQENLPGTRIHPDFIRRMTGARDPLAEGVALAAETIRRLKATPGVRGVHLMPSLWEGIVPAIVRAAGAGD